MSDSNPKSPLKINDVTIIGAGISGLSLAYYLQQRAPHLTCTLLEASARAGGVIATHKDYGCVIDQGPDSFITLKPHAFELCKELGLQQDLIAFGKNAKTLWMVKNGQLAAFPEGLYLGLPKNTWNFLSSATLPLTMKLRMGLDLFHSKKDRPQDVSLGDFLRDHFGKQSIDLMFNPILGGIYAAHVDVLSTQATFPQFLDLEKKFGSLIRGLRAQPLATHGRSPFLSLRHGMGQLIEALQQHIPASTLKLNHAVNQVRFQPENNTYTVVIAGHTQPITSRHVVFAMPPARAQAIVQSLPKIAKCFESFSASSTAVVFFGFNQKDIGHKLTGLGFLVPKREGLKTLAGTFVSNKFDGRSPENTFLLRTFFGGLNREGDLDVDDATLSDVAWRETQRILGISASPIFSKIFRYQQQSPLYSVGHLEQVREVEQTLRTQPNLHYLSNALYGVGIPDCIRKAKELAEQLAKK